MVLFRRNAFCFSFLLYMYESIKQFYKSNEWRRCRQSYFKLRKGLCERCLAQGIVQVGDEVHHKKRLTLSNINNPKVTLNYDNLELLCAKCHQDEHKDDRTQMFSKRRYTVNADGSVIPKDIPLSKKDVME